MFAKNTITNYSAENQFFAALRETKTTRTIVNKQPQMIKL